jgi:hypothetical protein
LSYKKNILIFQTGEPTHFDQFSAPMRLINLTNILADNQYNIEVIAPLFSHQEKKFRNLENNIFKKHNNINYTFINSPGYKNNISLSRFYDHVILAKNLKKKLNEFKNINYVFIGYPPIESCFILSRWCKKNKIPYMIDYKDLWPELFIINKNFFFKILLFPLIFFLKILRNYSLKNSKSISTISNSFLDDLSPNYIKNKKIVCYLTKKINPNVDSNLINNNIKLIFNTPKKKIVFIGNFMIDIYDFKILEKIKDFIIKSNDFEFHLFGSGPAKKDLYNYLNFKNIYIHDMVNTAEFHHILSNSHAVFLPIKNRFDYIKSIPNKIVDAIQYHLPIFTCLQGETKKLVQKYNLGFVYEDYKELQDKINYFFISSNFSLIKKNFENPTLQNIFNHKLNYQSILDRIKIDLKDTNHK